MRIRGVREGGKRGQDRGRNEEVKLMYLAIFSRYTSYLGYRSESHNFINMDFLLMICTRLSSLSDDKIALLSVFWTNIGVDALGGKETAVIIQEDRVLINMFRPNGFSVIVQLNLSIQKHEIPDFMDLKHGGGLKFEMIATAYSPEAYKFPQN